MTRDEILNMPAGREMDALVSAIVETMPKAVTIGELRKTTKDWRFSYCRKASPLGWWSAQIGTDAGDDDQPAKWEPFYEVSREIDAAWVVLQKLRSTFCMVSITQMSNAYICMAWKTVRINESPSILSHAPTAPLAIGRAALLTAMEPE